ncbi:helix-turn-helix domain-containing protein [Paenisporosarcina cavernae]|uniref:helix-turn-helix domain-containing protein n=1 Tax=Paenisporosarcina cavernae TaxID=2320858 RepID=UPI0013C5315E|nr:helix-turn-helix domain-containing protein [Paenisporosarcina cavernae]
MLFTSILLELIENFKGERSFRAPYYILQGKRSGQTIQDLHQLKLYPFFHLLPKLNVKEYDAYLQKLVKEELIVRKGESLILTSLGMEMRKNHPAPSLFGWKFKGNELIFGNRLNLIIQTLSHLSKRDRHFVPMIRDERIRQYVKVWIRNTYYQGVERNVLRELENVLTSAIFPPIERAIFVYRLSGKSVTSLTWSQLADKFHLTKYDVYIYYVMILQKLIHTIEKEQTKYPILVSISADLYTSKELTNSAQKTWELFQQGYVLHDIANKRRLKSSTIEDHFVEIASVYPDVMAFFLEDSKRLMGEKVLENVESFKLSALKPLLPTFSYFELRLLLTWKENGNGQTGSNT